MATFAIPVGPNAVATENCDRNLPPGTRLNWHTERRVQNADCLHAILLAHKPYSSVHIIGAEPVVTEALESLEIGKYNFVHQCRRSPFM